MMGTGLGRGAALVMVLALSNAPPTAHAGAASGEDAVPAVRAARVDLGRGAFVNVRATEARAPRSPQVEVEIQSVGREQRQRLTYGYGYPLMAQEGRLCFRDYDHDGYLDLSVLKVLAGKFRLFAVWRYDPGSGRFVEDALTAALGELTNLRVDADRGQVVSSSIGPAHPYRRAYSVIGGALQLEESCEFLNEGSASYLRGTLATSRRGQRSATEELAVNDSMDVPCRDPEAFEDSGTCF